MDITLNKKDITALACEGCKKKFISNIYHNSLITKGQIDSKLTAISEKDEPALWTKSGLEGERDIIVSLARSGERIVSIDASASRHFAHIYKYATMGGNYIEVNNANAGNFKKEAPDDIGKNLLFDNTVVNPLTISRLVTIAKDGIGYIYQFCFAPVFSDISGLLESTAKTFYGKHNMEFTNQRPDFIHILPPDTNKRILDKDYSMQYNDGKKYILEVADVKSSEFNRSFFFELSLYMSLLKGWIDRNGLSAYFDVSYSATIFSYDVLKSQIRDEWIMDFALAYPKFKQVFNRDIIDCIDIVNLGKVSEFLNVEVGPNCQVCDYYGGQYEGKLKGELDKLSPTAYESYLMDPTNHFCRYYLDLKDDINIIPSLRVSDVHYLKNKGINDLSTLKSSLSARTTIADNVGLLSNGVKIDKEIDVHKSGTIIAKKTDTNLLPDSWPDLQLYVLIRQDSQGRTLSYGVAYSILINDVDISTTGPSMKTTGPNAKGNYQLSDNNMSAPYYVLLEDYSIETQLVETIDFIEEIYNIREKYKKVKHTYSASRGKQVTYGFFFWGEKTFSAFKNSLQEVIKYLTVPGNTIASLYTKYGMVSGRTYSASVLKSKEKNFNKAMQCFSDMFRDEDVTYFDRIKNSPLFDLKYIYEELVAVDTNFSYNLIDTYNSVIKPTPLAFNFKYRPDSDNYSLYTYDKWWSNWTSSAARSHEWGVLKKFDELHLVYISKLREWIYTSSIGVSIKKRGGVAVLGNGKNKGGIKTPQLQYVYLYQKLNTEYDRLDIENTHTATREKKEFGGEAIYLDRLLTNSELATRGITLGVYQRAYWVSPNSVNANIDETSFALTFFPENKFKDTYARFYDNNPAYHIYMDPARVTLDKWMKNASYRSNVQCKIVEFNRIDRIIIIQLTRTVQDIVNELEKTLYYDFSKAVIIENAFSDVWTERLKSTIQCIENDTAKLSMIMTPNFIKVNSITDSDISTDFSGVLGGRSLELDPSQINAIKEMFNNSITVLWGPPGTGKSHTLAHSIIHHIIKNSLTNKKYKILLLGNYNATNNILDDVASYMTKYALPVHLTSLVQVARICAKDRVLDKVNWPSTVSACDWSAGDPTLSFSTPFAICTITPEQMARFTDSRFASALPDIDIFDLVIVDEASQMDVTHFLPALLKADSNTQIVIAGDDKQLQPIRKERIEPDEDCWFGSIYDYYNRYLNKTYGRNSIDLQISRRSNDCIVNFIRDVFDYNAALKPDPKIVKQKVAYGSSSFSTPFLKDVLNPDYGLVLTTYEDGVSAKCNMFEANKTVEIVKELYRLGISNGTGTLNFKEFFEKGIGVVVPHRAQKAAVQKSLCSYFSSITIGGTYIPSTTKELCDIICSSVDTVDRFQGRQREVIIASYVLGNEDAISEEEEFIYDTHRLNVIISRAKWKAILIASNELLDNLSNDLEVLDMQKAFQKLKVYCNSCIKTISDPSWNKGVLYTKQI